MVDINVRRSLNLLHINKCNQVDILSIREQPGADDDCPKEEYMETTSATVCNEYFTTLSYSDRDSSGVLLVPPSSSSSEKLSFAELPTAMCVTGSPSVLLHSNINSDLPINVHSTPVNPPYMTELTVQMALICRCCLSTQRDLQPIFDTENCIPDMIMALATGVELVPEDTLPSKICMPCVLQLSRALTFKQQLETADVTLREFCIEGGYARGTKLPASLDSDVDAEVTNVATVADNEVDSDITITAITEIHLESQTQPNAEDVDYTDLTYGATSHVMLDLSTDADRLIDHVLDSNEIDDEDFIRLADPSGEPPTLDTMQHLHLLDSNAPAEMLTLPLELTLSSDCGDVESLLQPMAADQQQPVAKTRVMDGVDEDDEEDDDDEEEDDEDVYTIDLEEDIDYEDDSAQPLEDTVEKIPITKTDFTDENNCVFPADSVEATTWACFICNKEYAEAGKLRRHQRTHDARKMHVCTVCHKAFHLHSELQRHEKRHIHKKTANQPQGGYPCDECSLSFNLAGDLRVHQSLHTCTDGRFVCSGCDKQLDSLLKLKRHVRIHYEDKPHKCAVCDKGFPERGSLTRHFRRHTDDVREKKHECKDCGKRYFDTHALSVHRRTHTGERPWQCTFCDKSFIDSRLLQSHLRVHSMLKLFACDLCDRRFTHRSTLSTHRRTHTGDRPYVCTECGKTFIQSSNLLLHMRTHSGERPYACDQCERSFASSSALRTHQRTHTGEKPYACMVCQRKFSRNDLRNHMRTHTGERPFACPTCSRRFVTSSHLKVHMRSHTGERPFECSECGKACSSAAYLRKHAKMHVHDQQQQQHLRMVTTPSNNRASLLAKATVVMEERIDGGPVIAGTGFDAMVLDICDELTGIMPHIEVLHELSAADAMLAMGDKTKPMAASASTGNICQVLDPNILCIHQVRSVGAEVS